MDTDPIYVKAWWALLAAFSASGAWFAKWVFGKIEGKADRSELVEVLKRMDKSNDEARESRAKLYERVDAISSEVTQTRVNLAKLEGRLRPR